MICWLASFPKSGNTWMRSLLADYIFFSEEYSFENSIYKIKQFPTKTSFDYLFNENILKEGEEKKFINLTFSSQYWQVAQERIIMQNKNDFFLKTHGVPCKINNNFFVSTQTTKAAICIIRDPRQVTLSMMNHFNYKSQQEAFDHLINNKLQACHFNYKGNKEVFCFYPSPAWDIYYNSWKICNTKFPVYFVKYEDMFHLDCFYDLLKFLNTILDIPELIFDSVKAKEVFDRSNLNNLKKIETKSGFTEKLEKDTKNFFNEGEKSTWKEILDKNIVDKIEIKFKTLMKEFNYI